MRHPDYHGPGRRPVSELSPRQFYVQNQQSNPPQQQHTDPSSLPRRRLPEIPHQRRLPDTLPRTARPSYTLEVGLLLSPWLNLVDFNQALTSLHKTHPSHIQQSG